MPAMPLTSHNPGGVFPPYRRYAHAVEVPAGARTLYVSGLNGYEADGVTMPADFAGQAALRLAPPRRGARFGADDLRRPGVAALLPRHAPPTTRPTSRRSSGHLGDHRRCAHLVVQQLLELAWLLEVEAVAANVD